MSRPSKPNKSKKPAKKVKNISKENTEVVEEIASQEAELTTVEVTPVEVSPSEEEKLILALEKKKKEYWTEDTEAAVIEFLNHDLHYYSVQIEKYLEDCHKKRVPINENYLLGLQLAFEEASSPEVIISKDKIYRDRIQKPLIKLIENIMFSYKLFKKGVDIKTQQLECLSFVYTKFANFNPNKNTKSFSYFGTVAKHFMQGDIKDQDKYIRTNLDYDDHRDEADGVDTFELDERSDLDTSYTLFNHVIQSIEDEMDKGSLSDNDMKVGDAIIEIFKKHEALGAYNKNHVYQLIKESTGLQTKDITYSLSRFRIFYRILKQDFMKRDNDDD